MKPSIITLCSGMVLSSPLGAATATWEGGGGNSLWTTTTNWQGGTPPVAGAGDTATFPGSPVFDFNPDNNIANLGLAQLNINTISSSYNFHSTSSTPLTFVSGGLIEVNQSSTVFVSNFNLPITLAGTTTIDSIGPAGSAVTFSQDIGGSGPVNITSSGGHTFTVKLNGASSYTAGTNLNKGTLQVGNSSALGNGTLTFGVNSGNILQAGAAGLSLSNPISLSQNGVVDTFGFIFTLTGTISGAGSLSTKADTGTLVLPNANSYLGGTVLAAVSKINIENSGSLSTGVLTFSGGILQAGANGLSISNPISIAVGAGIDTNGFSMTLTGAISNAGPLSKNGAGTLFLPNGNSYGGGTFIDQGTLNVGNNSSLGSGTLTFSGTGGILQAGTASLSLSNAIDLEFDGTVDTNGQTLTLTGVISDSGSLTKTGAGTLVLTNANSYRATFLNQGTINVQNNSALGSLPLTFNNVDGNILQAGASSLSLSNDIILTNSGVVDTNSQNLTLSGSISSSGSLTKTGAGTLTISQANSYMGGTFLNQGTLAVTNSTALGTNTLTFNNINGNILQAGAASLSLANAVSLASNGTVDTNSQNLTLSGSISNSGTLTKINAGTLTLSNANSYGGGTTFNQGTLAVGSSTALGTGTLTFATNDGNILQASANNPSLANAITLNKNGVIDSNNQTFTLAGPITGAGSLNKIGAGQLILSGTSTFGPTTVSTGMLTIDGSITSTVNVLPSTFLNGSGSIGNDVTVGGTLGPGDAIGTLSVAGNVNFQSGSTFQVEADPSRADQLMVSSGGNINIASGSTIEVTPTPGTYGFNSTYVIAEAFGGGSVIGTFDNVVNTLPLISAQISYVTLPPSLTGPNAIEMTLNFQAFSFAVTHGNPGALAKSLDGFIPPAGSDLLFVYQQLFMISNMQDLIAAFNQMQPSILNSISLAEQSSNFAISSLLFDHTSELYLIRSPCTPVRKKRWQVWGDGAMNWTHQHGNSKNVGYHAKADLGIVGADYRINDHFFIGAAGAYTHTHLNTTHLSARGRMDTFYAGLYSSYLSSLFFVNASVLGLTTDYHSKRSIHFGSIDRHPRGEHRGFGLLSHLDIGACLPKFSRAQVYPYGKLDYLFQHEEGYTEHNAQSLNNHIRARNTDVLRSELGLQGRYCYSTKHQKSSWIPSAKLGWVRETRFHGQRIHARLVDVPNGYSVIGLYPVRSMLVAGASLTAILVPQTVYISATYEGLFCGKFSSNEGSLELNLEF